MDSHRLGRDPSRGLCSRRVGEGGYNLTSNAPLSRPSPDHVERSSRRRSSSRGACRVPRGALPRRRRAPGGTLLAVEIAHPDGPLELYATYVPVAARQQTAKIVTLEALQTRLARASTVPRVLCGDFNTPQAELPDGTLVTFGQSRRRGGGWNTSIPRQDAAERSVLRGLAS